MILKFIEQTTIVYRGYNCWLSRKYIIIDKLRQLQPDKPEDGDMGKLAFNVLGKDRMKIKTGRFLTRKLSLNNGFLSDVAIAEIAGKINMLLWPDIETKLVSSNDITKNYSDEVGGYSCMTGGNSDYVGLYADNPNKIQQLVMFFNADSARAILWKLDNGQYFLDRVYATCEMLKGKMVDYALEKGWSCKDNGSYDCDDLIVSSLAYNDGEIPYMDTMICGYVRDGDLTVSANGCCDYELQNQDGQLEAGYVCESCDERISEGEQCCVNDMILCTYCVERDYTYCECCGEYIYNDDIIRIEDINEYMCSSCASDEAVRCEDCDDYYKEDYVVIEDTTYCVDCAEKYVRCEDCGEQFIDNDCVNEDGLCEDCRPELVIVSAQALHLPTDYKGQTEFDI